MEFLGENLLPGQLGHFFVLLSFICTIVAGISFFSIKGDGLQDDSLRWLKLGRAAFIVQSVAAIAVFSIIFYICYSHLYEYMYAYKHASKELEPKYLLACIWEGQEGSFLLWSLCVSIIGLVIIFNSLFKQPSKFEGPVMGTLSLMQFFMFLMILGIYVGDVRIGNSLFALTRNEIAAPIFSRPDYLEMIKDGMGLNVLLRNYWMVIHPPTLFLGFSLLLVPFAYALGSLIKKDHTSWVKPAMPWVLCGIAVLGVGIMMGGKWAYESLSFGGYWAWDPVENASLVPWLILIAGLHTMLIFNATGHSLKASYIFIFLSFIFVLYSTFLTRTGILGETSVHSFTEAGTAINAMIGTFVLSFFLLPLFFYIREAKKIPSIQTEESFNSREFWMYIGSLVFFLTAIFIIAKTSVPVYNKITGSNIAPPEDVEFSYNKVMALVAIIIGVLTAITQYFRYKATPKGFFIKGILTPTLISAALTLAMALLYPFQYYKHGAGFLAAIYGASFAVIYAIVANGYYLFTAMKGRLLKGGGSIAHLGFALMILGMLISSSNKQTISDSKVNGITLPASIDPQTKQQDNPMENLTLIRQIPTTMGNYMVTFLKDSLGHEKGRKFYRLLFSPKDTLSTKKGFELQPDVYVMKDNNMSSNPDTRAFISKDIFTYISYAMNDTKEDTASFKISELHIGDTAFYSNGYVILNNVDKNAGIPLQKDEMAIKAIATVHANDGRSFTMRPIVKVDQYGINHIDDTLYAQNMFVRFDGVTGDGHIKLGIKEANSFIDFITVKAFIFPWINLVWLGLVLMAIGSLISMFQRGRISRTKTIAALVIITLLLTYLFLFANQ